MINTKLLAQICEESGPPGREQKIREIVAKELTQYVDSIKTDNLGNLIVLKKGKKKKSYDGFTYG